MFHNSKLMMKDGNGPFFYLPKVICRVFVIENPLCNEHLPMWYLVNLCFNTSNKHLLPHLPPLVFFIKKYWYRIKLLLLSLLFSFYNGIVTCKRVVSFLSSHPQYLSWTMASIYGHLNNNTVTVTADERIKGFDQRFNILGAIQFSSWNDSFFKSTSALLENIPMPFLNDRLCK